MPPDRKQLQRTNKENKQPYFGQQIPAASSSDKTRKQRKNTPARTTRGQDKTRLKTPQKRRRNTSPEPFGCVCGCVRQARDAARGRTSTHLFEPLGVTSWRARLIRGVAALLQRVYGSASLSRSFAATTRTQGADGRDDWLVYSMPSRRWRKHNHRDIKCQKTKKNLGDPTLLASRPGVHIYCVATRAKQACSSCGKSLRPTQHQHQHQHQTGDENKQ